MSKSMKDLGSTSRCFDSRPSQGRGHSRHRSGSRAYTVTQGIPSWRTKIQATVDAELGHADRQVLTTSGTSGRLSCSLYCVVDPGDEVIVVDPYFVLYRHLATLAGEFRCWSTRIPSSTSMPAGSRRQ